MDAREHDGTIGSPRANPPRTGRDPSQLIKAPLAQAQAQAQALALALALALARPHALAHARALARAQARPLAPSPPRHRAGLDVDASQRGHRAGSPNDCEARDRRRSLHRPHRTSPPRAADIIAITTATMTNHIWSVIAAAAPPPQNTARGTAKPKT